MEELPDRFTVEFLFEPDGSLTFNYCELENLVPEEINLFKFKLNIILNRDQRLFPYRLRTRPYIQQAYLNKGNKLILEYVKATWGEILEEKP